MKEFLKDFQDNAEKWYDKQKKEDFCFDEETQLAIIDYCSHSKEGYFIFFLY